MTARGSCLCGAVSFAVTLPFVRFVHCHCSRCRKATGTAHATNAVVKAGGLHWLHGEEWIVRYDLPTAQLRYRLLPQMRLAAAAPHARRQRGHRAGRYV
jgi:Glutathione-dependent formaldehyde-activating enzyme